MLGNTTALFGLDARMATDKQAWNSVGGSSPQNFDLVPSPSGAQYEPSLTNNGTFAGSYFEFPSSSSNSGYYRSTASTGFSGDPAMTVCLTYMPSATRTWMTVFGSQQFPTTSSSELGFISNNDYPGTDGWGGLGRIKSTTATSKVAINHVCFSMASVQNHASGSPHVQIYMDGATVAMSNNGGSNGAGLGEGDWTIGYFLGPNSAGNTFNGRSDLYFEGRFYNLAVWSRALTQGEVTTAYQSMSA